MMTHPIKIESDDFEGEIYKTRTVIVMTINPSKDFEHTEQDIFNYAKLMLNILYREMEMKK